MNRAVVCVFCGASPGKSEAHVAAARALAQTFHKHEIKLVYGGGTVGVMGELAKTLVALSGPEAVHGVIPKALLQSERNYGPDVDPQEVIEAKRFGRTTVVADMHERKGLMAKEVMNGGPGSGFVALSGGFGTLEELAEATTWNQLGIHGRPIVAFSVEGFWTPLLTWVTNAADAGFITERNQYIMVEAKSPEEVVEKLRDYKVSEGRMKLHWDEK